MLTKLNLFTVCTHKQMKCNVYDASFTSYAKVMTVLKNTMLVIFSFILWGVSLTDANAIYW